MDDEGALGGNATGRCVIPSPTRDSRRWRAASTSKKEASSDPRESLLCRKATETRQVVVGVPPAKNPKAKEEEEEANIRQRKTAVVRIVVVLITEKRELKRNPNEEKKIRKKLSCNVGIYKNSKHRKGFPSFDTAFVLCKLEIHQLLCWCPNDSRTRGEGETRA